MREFVPIQAESAILTDEDAAPAKKLGAVNGLSESTDNDDTY
jgi:hypothetical protein